MHTMSWVQTWNDAFDELSGMQTIFCVCGKVASGWHERNCKKFREKVDGEVLDNKGGTRCHLDVKTLQSLGTLALT